MLTAHFQRRGHVQPAGILTPCRVIYCGLYISAISWHAVDPQDEGGGMDHLLVVCSCCTGDMHVPGNPCGAYQRNAARSDARRSRRLTCRG